MNLKNNKICNYGSGKPHLIGNSLSNLESIISGTKVP